jgi:hypothetical protein
MSQAPKGRAVIEMLLDTNQLTKSLKKVEDNFKKVGANILKIGAGFTGFGAGLIGALVVASNEAGDAAEIFNRFEAVFKGASREVRAFGAEVAKSIGRSEKDVAEALSVYQSFFIGLGKGDKEATELSKTLTTLALDFASFNNLSDADAQRRFVSGLSGSAEVFDRFGINIKAAALDQKLLQQGLNKTTATASENEKVMARLAIIVEALGRQGALGDAVKTAGSYSNVVKRLTAAFTDLKVAIGDAVLGDITAFNSKLASTINNIKNFIKQNEGLVKSALIAGAALIAAGAIVSSIGVSFIAAGFAISGLSSTIAIVASSITLVVTSLTALGSAVIAVLSSPLATLAIAIGAIAVSTLDLKSGLDDLRKSASSDFSSAFLKAKDSFDLLKRAVLAGDLKLAFQILAKGIELFFRQAFNSIIGTFDIWVANSLNGVNEISSAFNKLGAEIVASLAGSVVQASQAADLIKNTFISAFKGIETVIAIVTAEIKKTWLNLTGLVEAGIAFKDDGFEGLDKVLEKVQADKDLIEKELEKTISANINLEANLGDSDFTKQAKAFSDGAKDALLDVDKDREAQTKKLFNDLSIADKSRVDEIKKLADDFKFLGLAVKRAEAVQTKKNLSDKDTGKDSANAIKSLIPKFGALVETGSGGALKLFGTQNNPLVKEQIKTNKTLLVIANNTEGLTVK